jgi:hypothetical protein
MTLKKELDQEIVFIGSEQVPAFAVSPEDNRVCRNMAQQARESFDFALASDCRFLASRIFDNLDSYKHTVEVDLEGLQSRLSAVGLYIPSGYVFTSKESMMGQRFGNGERSGEVWSEGEVFTFTRQFHGQTIFSDNCVAAIRNDDVLLYTIKNHALNKKPVPETIKKLSVNTDSSETGPEDVESELVYEVNGGVVIPLWHISYKGYVFKYNAISGETYRDN